MLMREPLLAAVLAVPMMLAAPAHAAVPEPVEGPAVVDPAEAADESAPTPPPLSEATTATDDELWKGEVDTVLTKAGLVAYESSVYEASDVAGMLGSYWLVVDGIGNSWPIKDLGGNVTGELPGGTVVAAGPAYGELWTESAWVIPIQAPTGGIGWVDYNNITFAIWPADPELNTTLTATSSTPVHTGADAIRMELLGTVEEGQEVRAGEPISLFGSLLGGDNTWLPVELDDQVGWVEGGTSLVDPTVNVGAPAARGDAAIEGDDAEPAEASPSVSSSSEATTPDPTPEAAEKSSSGFPLWVIPAGVVVAIMAWLMAKRKNKPTEEKAEPAPAVFQDDDDDDFDPWAETEAVTEPEPEAVVPEPEPVDEARPEPEVVQDDIDWDNERVRPGSRPIDSELETS